MQTRWFWSIVVAGPIIVWLAEYALSQLAPGIFSRPANAAFGVVLAIVCGALWRRLDRSLLAAASIAIPLAVVWTFNAFVDVPRLAHLAIYAVGVGFFVVMASSAPLVGWWYRVILRTARQPPLQGLDSNDR